MDGWQVKKVLTKVNHIVYFLSACYIGFDLFCISKCVDGAGSEVWFCAIFL